MHRSQNDLLQNIAFAVAVAVIAIAVAAAPAVVSFIILKEDDSNNINDIILPFMKRQLRSTLVKTKRPLE